MRKVTLILMLICSLALAGQVFARQHGPDPVGDELVILDTSSVSGFTSIPSTASTCYVYVEGDPIRFRLHTTDPTANLGAIWIQGNQPLVLQGPEVISSFKAAIKAGGSGSTLYGVFYDKGY